MSNPSAGACQHDWCERDGHAAHPYAHESSAVSVPGLSGNATRTLVSYEDGDRQPLLFVGGGDVELTADRVDELIAVLREQAQIMRSVQPVGTSAGRAA